MFGCENQGLPGLRLACETRTASATMDAGSAINFQRVVLPNAGKSSSGITDSCASSVVATLKLTDATVSRLHVAKVFERSSGPVNALSFSDSGERLLTSGDDDQICVYDAVQGTFVKDIGSKKYGCEHVIFTHNQDQGLHASNKVDHGIRHLDLTNSKYIRYFTAHSGKVDLLKMCPQQDVFMSGSGADRTFRLWDVRSAHCQGAINMFAFKPVDPASRHALSGAFDPSGLAFALGSEDRVIRLYDLRTFDKGPFTTFRFDGEFDGSLWEDIKFSHDGRKLLVTTTSKVLLLDSFSGETLKVFRDHRVGQGGNDVSLEACFSPCSRYVFTGTTDGKLYAWSVVSGARVAAVSAGDSLCGVLRFNPKFFMLASASMSISFWVPSVTGEDDFDTEENMSGNVLTSSPSLSFDNHPYDGIEENGRFTARLMTDNLSRVFVGH